MSRQEAAAAAAPPPAGPAATAATPTRSLLWSLSPYLDVHMVLALVAFAESLGVYRAEDVKAAKLAVLDGYTNMVNYAIHVSGEEASPERASRRDAVLETMASLKASADPVLSVLDDEKQYEELKAQPASGREGRRVTEEVMDALFNYGKFVYECGDYTKAAKVLAAYRELEPAGERAFDALWGKLAAQILTLSETPALVDACLKDVEEIFRTLESREVEGGRSPLEQLQLRAWVLHWSLFVYFSSADGKQQIADAFLNDRRNRNVIETLTPWLLRYVAAATIANKGRQRHALKALAATIQLEGYEYRDPITEFVHVLITDFDFERALDLLEECDRVMAADYFLVGLRAEFAEAAKAMVFETHCRVNARVDLGMLSARLGMPADDAEKWIVDLVRGAKLLDAKIDLESNSVAMGRPQVAVWQTVTDKTKDLSLRTFALVNGIATMQRDGLI